MTITPTQDAPTPGPWEATERHDFREVLGPREGANWYGRSNVWAVAYIDTDLDEAVQDANARLIAAAPELVAALEDCASGLEYVRHHYGDLSGVGFDRALSKAHAALAKAKAGVL